MFGNLRRAAEGAGIAASLAHRIRSVATVGIITGSGTYALPDFEGAQEQELETPFGSALVTSGRFAGAQVLHISRHGEGHRRLSNHVNHRANIWALKQLGADAVIGCTACGAL